ncbi:MAG: hypothetical protein ABWY35_10680, partial [Pseudorhodoplanes sp.]
MRLVTSRQFEFAAGALSQTLRVVTTPATFCFTIRQATISTGFGATERDITKCALAGYIEMNRRLVTIATDRSC